MHLKPFIILFFSTEVLAIAKISLSGTWAFKKTDDSNTFNGTVPGGIYTDLMNNKIIGDIFYGYNDTKVKWVCETNWTYSKTFLVKEDFLKHDVINIIFEGLDTFADIFLNDIYIGSSENMFIRYIFNLKSAIKPGNNVLKVSFISPVLKALLLSKEQDYDIPPDCPPSIYNGECHINQIRKMQASFSWDWGPSFPSVGIWKKVYIEAYNETTIRYLLPILKEQNDNINITIKTFFNSIKSRLEGKLLYSIEIESSTLSIAKTINETILFEEVIVAHCLLIGKQNLKRWWPNGYGSQTMYSLKATFISTTGSRAVFHTKYAFRTVELVQEKLKSGLTFYFKLNGVPIFAKGSNQIPFNILPERGYDKKTVKHLLKNTKEANMNMLRVWGGGVYESDYFYNLADRYGIMIWQDFMFACSMYPSKDHFLKNVKKEVRHQVRRIGGHPSIVLFSGNNENEGALRENWYGTEKKFKTYKNDYIKLYIETIQNELRSNLDSVFVTSSPSNGDKSIEEGYIAQNPGDNRYGDVHFYNYILDPWEALSYPIPRFASEYGYQSLPKTETFLKATSSVADLNIKSDFMNHRQHHPLGNLELLMLLSYNLQLPESNHPNYYKATIYYSQIVQAMAIKVETEHYRSYRSILTDEGFGLTMGALYWQLNDVWVAPTWSGIDYYGNWKMLHYFAKNFFYPIIVTASLDVERKLNFFTSSDNMENLLNITLVIKVYNYSDLKPISTRKMLLDIPKLSSQLVESVSVDDELAKLGCGNLEEARNNCFFYFMLQADNVNISPENFVFPGKLKQANLAVPKVSVVSLRKLKGEFEIVLRTDCIALFVWMDADIQGQFNKNGFLMVEAQCIVYFVPEDQKVTLEEFQEALTVTNLKDQQFFR